MINIPIHHAGEVDHEIQDDDDYIDDHTDDEEPDFNEQDFPPPPAAFMNHVELLLHSDISTKNQDRGIDNAAYQPH